MEIKITDEARSSLEGLDPLTRRTVILALRDIPQTRETDARLAMPDLAEDLWVHPVSDRLRAVYGLADLDHDGQDEIVVLQLVDRDLAKTIAMSPDVLRGGASDAVRLGYSLARGITQAG